MKTLTIGIPTYNRKDIIIKIVDKLLTYINEESDIEVLIIDDCSKDNTYEELKQRCNGYNFFKLKKNLKNLGLTGNITQLFLESKTKYILICSDEDYIIHCNLKALIDFLKNNKPVFVTTQFLRKTSKGQFIYRGKRKIKRILPKEFHASSFYISGLVFSVIQSKEILHNINNLIAEYTVAFIYPQVLLAAHLIIKYRNNYWLNIALVEQGVDQEPNVKMQDNSKYNSVSKRWEQYLGFVEYFENEKKRIAVQTEKEQLEKLIESHKKKLFYWLRWGVSTTDPSSLPFFDNVANYFFFSNIRFKFQLLFKAIFKHKRYIIEKHTTIPTKATWRLIRK